MGREDAAFVPSAQGPETKGFRLETGALLDADLYTSLERSMRLNPQGGPLRLAGAGV